MIQSSGLVAVVKGKVRTYQQERKGKRDKKPVGLVLYRGPSMLNASRIVVIATNIARKSKNAKIGPSVIVMYILADEGLDPLEAARTGGDASICGHCVHRPQEQPDGTFKMGSCYVHIGQGPLAVYRAYRRRTLYRRVQKSDSKWFRGRTVRLGGYGDPAAVPLEVLDWVCGAAESHIGYTHQWRTCPPEYARYCMASVETPYQRLEAIEKGYRTFRVRVIGQGVEPGEFICPASKEGGNRLTCQQCRACSGSLSGGANATPVILMHGSRAAGGWKHRIYEETMERLLAEEDSKRYPLPMWN